MKSKLRMEITIWSFLDENTGIPEKEGEYLHLGPAL